MKIKEHLNLEIIIGKTLNYSRVYSDKEYCFYEKDASFETKQYFTELKTNITDVIKLSKMYNVVEGDCDKLNEEHQNELRKQYEQKNS